MMESAVTTRMSSRRPPLHTCGVSVIAIADRAYTKAQNFNGPLGSMTKKIVRVASVASSLVCALQYQLLAVLSFTDAHILGLENRIEAIFPPSRIVFDKVDELVQIAETLPGKFDDAVNKLPAMIHQVPFLDWAVVCTISWLNFCVSILTHWGSGSTTEKEIVIDSINESGVVHEADDIEDSQNNSGNEIKEDPNLIPVTSGAETKTVSPTIMKCTYKDALEKVTKGTYKDVLSKGTKENIQKKADGTMETIQESNVSKEDTNEEGTTDKLEKEECRKKTKNFNVRNEETREAGTDVNIKEKEDGAKEETRMPSASKEATWDGEDESAILGASKMDQSISEDDPILALFESAWLMNPGERAKGSSVPRSTSYQW